MVLLDGVWYLIVAAARPGARTTTRVEARPSVRRCVKNKRQALMDDKE